MKRFSHPDLGIPVRSAFLGLAAGAGLTLVQMVGRAAGIWPISLEVTLGSLLTRSLDPGSWVLGLLIHLLASAWFGALYGLIFLALGRAGGARGAAVGAIHGLLSAAVLLVIIPAIHPLVPQRLAAPVLPAVIGLVLLRALYGWVIGAADPLYGAVPRHPAVEEPEPAYHDPPSRLRPAS